MSFGAAALAGEHFEDDDGTARALDHPAIERLMDLGNGYGDGLGLGIGAAALMIAGRIGENRQLTAAGSAMARSLLVSAAAVWALKVTVDARRPDGGRHSFPSGHTATAFAVAPVIAKHWGWKAGVVAYALAATTALARMEDRRHHLPDVLFGAGIGIAVGNEVVGDSRMGKLLRHFSIASRHHCAERPERPSCSPFPRGGRLEPPEIRRVGFEWEVRHGRSDASDRVFPAASPLPDGELQREEGRSHAAARPGGPGPRYHAPAGLCGDIHCEPALEGYRR
jgi:hypothetical protein